MKSGGMKEIRACLIASVITVISISAFGADPDPWIRMTRPSRCSGGVMHASREYGIWIATCKHCVSRPGRSVRLRFFRDGYTSPVVRGHCIASHPRYDCSIVVVLPGAYPYPQLPSAVPLSANGAYLGETVYAVGSYAGGTYAPAARKVAVTRLMSPYQLQLNSSAWGGHSGGAVVSESGMLVGVLWGSGNGYSRVTTSRAIIETLQIAAGPGQAMASVSDESAATPVSILRPVIEVSGTPASTEAWSAELADDPRMVRFDWRRKKTSGRLRFTWRSPDGTEWYVDGWPGYDRFIERMLKCRGFPKDCPDSVQWVPNPGAGRSPWTIPPNIIGGNRGPDARNVEIDRLKKQIDELVAASHVAAREAEDNARRLRLESEDESRRLKNELDDSLREQTAAAVATAARRQIQFKDETIRLENEIGNLRVSPPDSFSNGNDDHPLTKAADWIQDSRDRDRKLIEFVESVSVNDGNESEPANNTDFMLLVAAGIALVLGGGFVGRRMK
jgi:hypothetical protein